MVALIGVFLEAMDLLAKSQEAPAHAKSVAEKARRVLRFHRQ